MADRADLVGAIVSNLGELGSALLTFGSVDQAAQACGLSRATAYRRIADIRLQLVDHA